MAEGEMGELRNLARDQLGGDQDIPSGGGRTDGLFLSFNFDTSLLHPVCQFDNRGSGTQWGKTPNLHNPPMYIILCPYSVRMSMT